MQYYSYDLLRSSNIILIIPETTGHDYGGPRSLSHERIQHTSTINLRYDSSSVVNITGGCKKNNNNNKLLFLDIFHVGSFQKHVGRP